MLIETKFDIGQEAFVVEKLTARTPCRLVHRGTVYSVKYTETPDCKMAMYSVTGSMLWYPDGNIFPTEAEAVAECERRNRK